MMPHCEEGVCVCMKCFVKLESVSVENTPPKHFSFVFIF